MLARKPLSGTLVDSVLAHGTGGLNIGATRLHATDAPGGEYRVKRLNPGASVNATGEWKQDREYVGQQQPGRWPANVLLSHHEDCVEVGVRRVKGSNGGNSRAMNRGDSVYGDYGATVPDGITVGYADPDGTETVAAWDCAEGCPVAMLGEPSRFFYTAKASRRERNAGLPPGTTNDHPTCKPVALMRWLCRLVCPPGGTVLDPFAGSGTTGMAAALEGFAFLGIDQDAHYVNDIARYRIAHAEQHGENWLKAAAPIVAPDTPDPYAELPLFAKAAD